MSAEKFRVVIYTNTCEKKVSYIPATEDINIAIMPFQTADNGLIIVCQNSLRCTGNSGHYHLFFF
ncbi:PilI type IV pilus biogenesis protein [Escherichia coli]|nr:PilI type IV pilus biogenesis protein [Escherichia coli]